ncbi:MAG: alanine/ornithine racemase family PLP-dependent enzyme [Spirochaetaceae bacterium]|jgi:predicted amino acid racemase|nr:alanine/ornithine racemase family PLP-dependent enzyme [Spirochaetaceae bacterium]
MYPRLVINLDKLNYNLETLSKSVHKAGCSLMIVTKSFCADKNIVNMLEQSPYVDFLADSRIKNSAPPRLRVKPQVLLRLPQMCEIEDVIRYTDISLNSELATLQALSDEAIRQQKTHKVILMIDLGDLREGIFYDGNNSYQGSDKILSTVEAIQKMPGIEFYGIGTNLTCYGGVIPSIDNLLELCDVADMLKARCGVDCKIISGGNSSSYYLIEEGALPPKINNLRLGESFVLGNDTANAHPIDGLHHDAITLEAQIIELQTKPSLPIGERTFDAFGGLDAIEDKGPMRRAILAIGKQDVDPDFIKASDPNIEVLHASSDHLILDVTQSKEHYKVGDIISFTLGYSALLRLFTSQYVDRAYI